MLVLYECVHYFFHALFSSVLLFGFSSFLMDGFAAIGKGLGEITHLCVFNSHSTAHLHHPQHCLKFPEQVHCLEVTLLEHHHLSTKTKFMRSAIYHHNTIFHRWVFVYTLTGPTVSSVQHSRQNWSRTMTKNAIQFFVKFTCLPGSPHLSIVILHSSAFFF